MSLVCQLPPSIRALDPAHKYQGDHERLRPQGEVFNPLFCQSSIHHACLFHLPNCHHSLFLDSLLQKIRWPDEVRLEDHCHAFCLRSCPWFLEHSGEIVQFQVVFVMKNVQWFVLILKIASVEFKKIPKIAKEKTETLKISLREKKDNVYQVPYISIKQRASCHLTLSPNHRGYALP